MKRPSGFDRRGGDAARVIEPAMPPLEVTASGQEPERPGTSSTPVEPEPLVRNERIHTDARQLDVGGGTVGGGTVGGRDTTDASGLASVAPGPGISGDVRSAHRELRRAERAVRRRRRDERRRFTAHLRRRRRLWLIVGAAVAGLAVFVSVGVFTPIMAVREVRIEGAVQVDAAAVQSALAPFDGVPLALLDEGAVHRALEPFPLIERYAIERIPPQTLVLRIEERQPAIALEVAEGFALYDPAGIRIGTVAERPATVPLGSGAAANPTTAAFRAAARVVRDLPEEMRASIAKVSSTGELDITFTLIGGTQVVWGDASRTQQKAAVVQAMIASLGLPSVIDVSSPEAPVFR